MSEPLLQLEKVHRVLGIEELGGDCVPGPMARDPAARIGVWDARLLTESRDETAVEVGRWNATAAVRKEQRDPFAGLLIWKEWLNEAPSLPGVDSSADDGVDRLCVAGTGLVGRHIEEARGCCRRRRRRGWRAVLFLPANASDSKPQEFVAAQAGKQPSDCQRAQHGQRVGAVFPRPDWP